MGRRFHAFVLVVVLVSVVAPASAHADAEGSWMHPVDGGIARPFDPPRTRFGNGHLGVDLAVTKGTPVRAVGPGVVTFAGPVAGGLHVVVAHAGNLRTSYSFLASIRVRRGASVTAGEIVGTAGGTGDDHDGSVLHFGLRTGDTYLDPMALFRPIDLTEIVHLAPTSDPPRAQPSMNERRGLLAGFAHGLRAAVGGAGRLAFAAGTATARGLANQSPLTAAAVAGTVAWYQQRNTCDAHAPPANGEGGSGHRVMLVAGLDSSQRAGHDVPMLPAAALGYVPEEVNNYTYAKGQDYTAADTEKPLLAAARALAAQLRVLQRREPGREVDLIAHSQGGVVVEAFLTLIYKRDDRSFPPLGTVVTLSSPLRGDPLATAMARIRASKSGDRALRLADAMGKAVGMRTGATSDAVRDLASGSALRKRIDAARLPDEVQVTTIGSATDYIVPGNVTTLPDGRGTIVIPHGVNAHTAILDDPAAMRAVRSALEGKPLPCQSLLTAVAGNVLPITISAIEELGGDGLAALGHLSEGKL